MGSGFDWVKIKAEFVSLSLNDDMVKPSYFTNKYGMKYQTLMAKKKQQKWGAEVAKQRKSLEAQTAKKINSQLSTIDAEDVLDELKVRKKNMKVADKLQDFLDDEWAKRMQDPKERKKMLKGLTANGFLSGYDTVTKMRGKAAGLPDKLDINSKNLNVNLDTTGEHLSPADNRKRLAQSEELAIQLQGLLNEFEEEAIDVEQTEPRKSKVKKLPKGKGNK